MNVLFVCSRNKLRSPTAEQVFANWPGVEVSSAGLDDGCGNPVTPEDLAWADLVMVMEQAHRNKLSRRFKKHLKTARVIVLGIPDDYGFMDPALVKILQAKVPPFLKR
ncbi:MAG: phosphotyrosine protein phosphatase [Caulobacter vibrioides]|uniref:Phosphotyrosine protein phosphatase n=1 Tax=Caulobacter vibrioides TaxID=155892 RepID=A0A258DE16_CAUVI|nr:MAG: phosphotyrosine protein phosphatase [Caulobacter vibrioides]